jgi:hypothetical protein
MPAKTLDRQDDERQPAKVPQFVIDGFKAVRENGSTNMLDTRGVRMLAVALGHPLLATWLNDQPNRRIWSAGIFNGFEASS